MFTVYTVGVGVEIRVAMSQPSRKVSLVAVYVIPPGDGHAVKCKWRILAIVLYVLLIIIIQFKISFTDCTQDIPGLIGCIRVIIPSKLKSACHLRNN
jgi:hypothetical protein